MVATQKNASLTIKGRIEECITFRSPGDVQHVTDVANGPTLLAWCEVFEGSSAGILRSDTLAVSRGKSCRKRS